MGKQGRFGKYGETKRYDRLRKSKSAALIPKRPNIKPDRFHSFPNKNPGQKSRVSFRMGLSSDEDFIAYLSGKVFAIFGPYEEMVPEWLHRQSTVTIIACVNGKPAGFAMVGDLFHRYDLLDVTELLAIAVDPDKQRMGIGEALLKEVDKKASELHMKRIFLHTATDNHPARRLFTKTGYRPWEIKRTFYPGGQDAVVMAKETAEPL